MSILDTINEKLAAEPDRRLHRLRLLEVLVDHADSNPDNILFGLAQIAARAGADEEKASSVSTLGLLSDRLGDVSNLLDGMGVILRFHISGMEGLGGNSHGMKTVLTAYKAVLDNSRKCLSEVMDLLATFHSRDTDYLNGKR